VREPDRGQELGMYIGVGTVVVVLLVVLVVALSRRGGV
jgi:hypothetical protein